MKGPLQKKDPRMLLVLLAQAAWIILLSGMAAWWSMLMRAQADQIRELRAAAGTLGPVEVEAEWIRTQRIVTWEFGAFYVAVLAVSLLLFWMYWRDLKRARSIHAFFATLTHELRTPLTGIRLQADVLAAQLEPTAHSQKLVQRLLQDAARLEAEVSRALELARLEGGGSLMVKDVALKPLLGQLVDNWLHVHAKHASVNNHTDDVTILADPTGVQVVVQNLLENAIRHAGKPQVAIDLSTQEVNGTVVLKVRDNGQGSGEPGKLGRIYQRGSGSKGAGVGLYLVKTLMNRMGGSVEFASPGGFEASLAFKRATP